MSAQEQIDKLAKYILETCPELIIDGGAGDTAIAIIEKYRNAFKLIMNELGVPTKGYPAPVVNAYEIARANLHETDRRYEPRL